MNRVVVVEGVERRVVLPLGRPFVTSAGALAPGDALLVRLLTDGGQGWGECVAMAAPGYSSEYVEAPPVSSATTWPPGCSGPEVDADGVGALLAGVQGIPWPRPRWRWPSWTPDLRAVGRSLAERLGATRREVDCGVAVGEAPSLDALVDEVRQSGSARLLDAETWRGGRFSCDGTR